MSSLKDKLRARMAELNSGKSAAPSVVPDLKPKLEDKPVEEPVGTKREFVSVVDTDGLEGEALAFKYILLELEDKLENRVENFIYQLRDIHQHLRKDPEVATILTDEEIGLIVRGFKTKGNIILGAPGATGKTRKKVGPITADQL